MSKAIELLKRVLDTQHNLSVQIAYEIEEMLAQPEQTERVYRYDDVIPLYTAPPKREPLSDERLLYISNSINDYPDFGDVSVWQAFYIARTIEKEHGIGGEG